MLGPSEIETMRAALLYWQEEICPYGEAAARTNFEEDDARPLSASQIDRLRQTLASRVRYAIYDAANQQLLTTALWSSGDEAAREAKGQGVAAVILPAARKD